MNDQYNPARPMIMHIDLNSCFATVEQQSRPLLRHRPVAIVNRRTDKTSIVTASYEAKQLGVKVGMRYYEAKQLVPDIVMLESDPPKYRYVYRKLLSIMNDYSAYVRMKSIDEGIIDFTETSHNIASRNLLDVGLEIKKRLKDEVGCYMRCNIGIAPNRFLAKTAAGIHKPDGLERIDAGNLRAVFSQLKLTDLTGIAWRYEKRLNAVGITTPLSFLDADITTLKTIVFKSICGVQWHRRLRGWEVDKVDVDTKRVGRQYVLERRDLSRQEVIERLHALCESVGARLRKQQKVARGVYVYAKTTRHTYWHAQHVASLPFSTDKTIFALARQLFLAAPDSLKEVGVHCYLLIDNNIPSQLALFGDELALEEAIIRAVDDINSRYGDRTIHAAETLRAAPYVREKIPFGSTRYL